MKLPRLNWYDMSKYRGEAMGVAMLFVILFHVYVARQDAFYGLHRLGNIGVDMFLFVSGIGLWFSWQGSATKEPRLLHRMLAFLKRRYVRIFPAWLLVASAFYLPRYKGDVWDTATDIVLHLDFWTSGELTFWYLPAIMALYLVAPAYLWLVEKVPECKWLMLLPLVWTVAVQWVPPVHATVGHLEIFWSRVPVFLLGINVGTWVQQKRSLGDAAVVPLLTVWVFTFALCLYLEQVMHGRFPLFVERLVYIPLTVSTLFLLNVVFSWMPRKLLSSLAFIGTVSLEVYLLHAEFILKPLQKLQLGYWPTFLLTLACALPLGWVLHKAIEWTEKRLMK